MYPLEKWMFFQFSGCHFNVYSTLFDGSLGSAVNVMAVRFARALRSVNCLRRADYGQKGNIK